MSFSRILFFAGFLYSQGTSSDSYDELANSCVGKEDGEHWLLLDDNIDSKPVKLTCSNEYVILDVSKDNNLINYFSSFEKWHYAVGAPKNSDPVNWQEWFSPSADTLDATYYLSPDCGSCEIDSESQVFGSETSYYMTGNLAKLLWGVIGYNECDFDADTYQCYDCSSCLNYITLDNTIVCEATAFEHTSSDYKHAGVCGVAVNEASLTVSKTRKEAQSAGGIAHYKPSIGTDGRFCTCYQPSNNNLDIYSLTDTQRDFIINTEDIEQELDMANIDENEDETHESNGEKEKSHSNTLNKETAQHSYSRVDGHWLTQDHSSYVKDRRDTHIVFLNQNDFTDGTYRIKKSGTYIITEDIEFNFNNKDDYWPTSDQEDKYPGATKYRDPYHLGFFAGITIEADFVTIDLNGHSLKQSLNFYYQQRWFALIEFGNQQFLPGQGPAFFGSEAININDVTIKNGILGRTAHFAIHGNYARNILIENVHIRDFVTHGMQLNGWENLNLNNIEIGPSSDMEYLRGDYGHARIIIQRLRAIENDLLESEDEDSQNKLNEPLSFGSDNYRRSYTLSELIDELDLQMEMALNYALNRANDINRIVNDQNVNDDNFIDSKYISDEEGKDRWEAVKKQFLHSSGIPSASSITGLFLNFMGASVFSYAKLTSYQSGNGKLNNIYIHDIKHDMVESLRIAKTTDSGQTFPTPWNSDIPAELMFGTKDSCVNFREYMVSVTDDNDVVTQDENTVNEYIGDNWIYYGSIMTDSYISMATISDDWDYLGFLQISRDDFDLPRWAFGKDVASTDWRFGCNQDVMGHSGKGLIGMRVDGVDNLVLSNIVIDNLQSYSQLGTMACGNYEGAAYTGEGGHFKQETPMQVGFSGNNLQGLSMISSTNVLIRDNLLISNLQSDYGEGYGVSFWTSNDISIDKNALITVNNINTGLKLTDEDVDALEMPNRIPEACGVRMESDDVSELYDTIITFESNDDNLNVISCNVNGHTTCLTGDYDEETMYGQYFEDSTNELCANVNKFKQSLKNGENFEQAINENVVSHMSNIKSHLRSKNHWLKLGLIQLATIIIVFGFCFITFYCRDYLKSLIGCEKNPYLAIN